MPRKIIQSDAAPAPIGCYSQAVVSGNTVYISGQVPLVPGTKQLVDGGLREQVTRVFENILAITTAAGGSMNDISKVTVYLLDLENFTVVNDVMSNFFEIPYPARAVVGVNRLPLGAAIEIDAVMTFGSSA